MELILRNTADHYFVPGDTGQVVDIADVEMTVASVEAYGQEPMILTYGLRLIPGVVLLKLKPAQAEAA